MPNGMKTITRQYRVEKGRIGFLKFIFEAHDNLAVLTTLCAADGLVSLAVAPGCMDDVDAVITELSREMVIHEV